MKCFIQKLPESGSALAYTIIMTAVALVIVTGTLSWSATNAKQTDRANGYMRAVAAAEAANEIATSKISMDYLSGGESQVLANLNAYRSSPISPSTSPYWSDWEFSDGAGHVNTTYVQITPSSNYVVLDSTFAGLQGFATTCTIIANAHQPAAFSDVTGAVYQELQLARIPIFQFAMYTSGDMEIGNGQPFVINGKVHCNGTLYVEPITNLTFQSDVSAVGDILYQRHPLDSRSAPYGVVVYQGHKDPHVNAMTLPIGTTNTPQAVREITQPPPGGEDPNSAIGRLRYFNQVDMLVTVSNANIGITSGRFNGFSTVVSNSEVQLMVNTTNSFYDAREEKTIRPIDINVHVLADWAATNSSLRTALGHDLASVYVWDRRNLPGSQLGAVRVFNGRILPSGGFTLVTADPLYVWGHFNQPTDAYLGTTNTTTIKSASLAADAITILSQNWNDSAGTHDALPTTVNTAILAGSVDTTAAAYSGGMENFPRFLENWGGGNTFTYNGSMVKMFPSLYATQPWGKSGVYNPPARNWSFDHNFDVATKLPPLTPSLLKVLRSTWSTVAANQTNPPAGHL